MNVQYYNAALALINAASHVRQIDPEFATNLLDMAQTYKDKIVIDKELEKEIFELKHEIEKDL
jgi:hypothetical protein